MNEDPAIQARVAELQAGAPEMASLEGRYSRDLADRLKATPFDRAALAARGLGYEALDQMVFELLMGV